ncbi:uncharacterized protein LOC127707419 isoform X5 [Mytilus californianus]|uniref:uncharacterized protein LOC127707419 isoform X5 n=1 Tax=Mytilus californianus TaxID=6549 RepID=UPI002246A167|nr:uncharacterized protein LOC127707419 isoform X5 [Mytilus californianus]
MAESAYHNEALRRQRIIERKRDAQVRLLEGPQSNEMPGYGGADMKDTVLYSGPGHFEQSREHTMVKEPFKYQEGVVFKEVVHDPNFVYRLMADQGNPPLHVDPIYRIMYPGAVVTNNHKTSKKERRTSLERSLTTK